VLPKEAPTMNDSVIVATINATAKFPYDRTAKVLEKLS